MDGLEGPAVRMAHVQECAVGRAAPLEDGHLIPRGAADRHQLQPAEHVSAGHLQDKRSVRHAAELRQQLHSPAAHLHVCATMRPLLQSPERIRAVPRIQVRAGRDGVLPVLSGVTAVTARQRVLLVVIIPAEHTHRQRLNQQDNFSKGRCSLHMD